LFNRQSSPVQPVNYDIFYMDGSFYKALTSKSSSSYSVSFGWPLGSGSYLIKIVPWINGSRINGTNAFGTVDISTGGRVKKVSGGGVSVNLPPYISKNVSLETPTEATIITPKEVVPVKPKEEAAPPKKEEKPVAPKAAEKKLPSWVIPLVIIAAAMAIIITLVAYMIYLGKKRPQF
jgi:hypothetical protein